MHWGRVLSEREFRIYETIYLFIQMIDLTSGNDFHIIYLFIYLLIYSFMFYLIYLFLAVQIVPEKSHDKAS